MKIWTYFSCIIRTQWLVHLCRMVFYWHCDCSPWLILTNSTTLGPSIYDVHTEGEGSGSGGRMRTGGGAAPLTSSCLPIMQRSLHFTYQHFVLKRIKNGNFTSIQISNIN